MKTTIMCIALAFACVANATETSLPCSYVNYGDPKFKKSESGTWMGANNTWYKLNPDNASLWMSKDGQKWEQSKDGMWQDKEGKWLKIVDKDLKWSADGGKSWSSVPDWKWMGHDGKWYKFDKKWMLWEANA